MTFHAVQSMKNYEFTAIDGQLSAAPISNPAELLYFTAGSVYKKSNLCSNEVKSNNCIAVVSNQIPTLHNTDEVELVRLHLFWFVKLIKLKLPATNQVHAFKSWDDLVQQE